MMKTENKLVDVKKLFKNSTFFIFLVLIAMCVFTAIAEPAFLKVSNILSTARSFSAIAIAGIGVLMVILTGGIDLSVGSIYGLAGVISAFCCSLYGMPVWLSMIMGVIAGALFGVINGLLVVYCKLPPFIGTLGTQQIVRGICTILTQGYPVSDLPSGYMFLGQGEFLGIPMAIWCMIVVVIISAIFLNRTVTGRRIFALGGNAEATRISGINTKSLTILVYTLCAIMASFAGILTASKLGVGQPTAGTGFETDAITAAVVGGASLSGGAGSVLGAVIGAAIIGVLRNALVLLRVDSYWQMLIMGVVTICAVTADQLRHNKK